MKKYLIYLLLLIGGIFLGYLLFKFFFPFRRNASTYSNGRKPNLDVFDASAS
jgi:hypothetical protein